MFVPRLRSAVLALAATATLGGCSYGSYGYGGGVSVGYNSGYYDYYDPYYDDYGYGYGYNAGYYGAPYYGWYNGFYYPGIGIWVYDRHGKRHHWNKDHKRHWEGRRRGGHHGNHGNWSGNHSGRGNWSGYNRRPGSGSAAAPGAVATPRMRPQPNVRATMPQRHSTRQAIRSERSAMPARSSGRSYGGRGRNRTN
jgi:hypothetical protein